MSFKASELRECAVKYATGTVGDRLVEAFVDKEVPKGWKSVKDLSEEFGVPYDSVRKKLRSWNVPSKLCRVRSGASGVLMRFYDVNFKEETMEDRISQTQKRKCSGPMRACSKID